MAAELFYIVADDGDVGCGGQHAYFNAGGREVGVEAGEGFAEGLSGETGVGCADTDGGWTLITVMAEVPKRWWAAKTIRSAVMPMHGGGIVAGDGEDGLHEEWWGENDPNRLF